MEKQFENLNAAALAEMDSALANIADSAQLDAEQEARITQMTLQKIAPTAEDTGKIKRHGKKRIRLIGGLIAAAVAVGALGMGVSGWLNYNQPLISEYFGTVGEARLMNQNLPEPTTYTYGDVNVTLEAVLVSDYHALMLVSFSSVDPQNPIDFFPIRNNVEEWDVCLSPELKPASEGALDQISYDSVTQFGTRSADEGERLNIGGSSMSTIGNQRKLPKGTAWMQYDWLLAPEEESTTTDAKLVFHGRCKGLEIPVSLTPNIETVTFRADDGLELYISPIGFVTSKARNYELRYGDTYSTMIAHWNDGTESDIQLPRIGCTAMLSPEKKWSHTDGGMYEVPKGAKCDYGNPESYIGYLQLDALDSVEWIGQTFRRVNDEPNA